MKIRLLPHQINQLTVGRYADLHRNLLGVDIASRHIAPIHRDIYYVDARDPMGRQLITENTPAKCIYRTGEIYCLYDKRIPLTEARLVHEFLHRAARRRLFFLWCSGIDVNRKRTLLNEVLTEYLTSCILGGRYAEQSNPRNTYLPLLPCIAAVEAQSGRTPLAEAYLNGNFRFFQKYRKLLDGMIG